jgi:hypothetical protein
MEISIETELKFKIEECINCGIKFCIPLEFQKKLLESHKSFYCPNGHSMIYSGKTEAEKLRDELKRKEAEMSQVVEEKWKERNRADQAEKKLKRVQRGVCTCCNRTFPNLANHMKSKHPELKK